MTPDNRAPISLDAPRENFAGGIYQVNIPELGDPSRGKVRDNWIIGEGPDQVRLMVTTDRVSSYDRLIGVIPGKGQVLNMLSAFWFDETRDIIPNHMIAVPHPNVLIARQARETLPVEIVLRKYMAKSSTTTSIYDNYMRLGRRTIYGIDFPEGLRANEEFPTTILTPTTKAQEGQHDEELTNDQAREKVDGLLGEGTWDRAAFAAFQLFERASKHCLKKGIILVDTKIEIGIDVDGNILLIDEVFTPDSSRFWLLETYEKNFREGKTPDTFDKDILRRWLAEKGFKGEGPVPRVDPEIIDQMSRAYTVPYEMITGRKLPPSDPRSVNEAIAHFLNR